MLADEIIREILALKGWTQQRLAQRVGTKQANISKWLAGTHSPNMTRWAPVQDLIRADPDLWQLRQEVETGEIGIMGRVGAGSIIEPELEQIPPEGLYSVSLPFNLPAEMIGFEIDGDSMYPKYEPGDIIIVYKDPRHDTPAYIGQLVVVLTEDGRRYLKKLFSGSRAGLYRLESFNAEPIHDVSISWVGEIYASLPASQTFRTDPPTKKKAPKGPQKHISKR